MKFSVTIPAYKSNYLKECIESILVQTYTNFELVIVNDASPEDLDSIVCQFDDCRIRYYKNEKNCGAINVVDNWNICLNYSQGDYIICLGDDDKLLPNSLEVYKSLIEDFPGLGVYHGWTEIIDEKSNFVGLQEPRPLFENVYSLIWNRWNGRMQYIGDFVFDINLLKKNGGFYKLPLAWGSDDITAVIAASYGGIVNSQEIVFQYRVNSLTISKTGQGKLKMEALKKEKEWFLSFLSQQPENDLENKYYLLCSKGINKIFKKKYIYTISRSYNEGIVKYFLFWISNRKLYNLSLKDIIISFLYFINNTL